MKTLLKLTVPLALAACVAASGASAHPDGYDFRDNRDRAYDYRDDFRGDSRVSIRSTDRYLKAYDRDRRKRLAEAARESRKYFAERERERRKYRAEREREYIKRLREARRDHRHDAGRGYRARDAHYDGRYRRIRHDEDFWSVVLDVTYGY